MTAEEIDLLEKLITSFAGYGERFNITNQSLRVFAVAIAVRLRDGDVVDQLRQLGQDAERARRFTLISQKRTTRAPRTARPVLTEADASSMLLRCPKNQPGF